MKESHDIIIKKPISIWNRDLSISPVELFSSLGKAAVSGIVLDYKGVAENVIDAIKDISPEDKPAHAAWLLVYKSLCKSLSELIKVYEDFFSSELTEETISSLATELDLELSSIEVGFDTRFFDAPHKLEVLNDIEIPLTKWLVSLGMSQAQAYALHLRLKERFVLNLHAQWLESPNDYACIEEAINSPFIKATKAQRDWMQYRAKLQELPNERMFAEAFSLSQVFIPLRAYYNEKDEKSNKEINNTETVTELEERRIVVDLHTETEKWVRNFNADNAVKIISGGPGSGKSSFGKIFAAFVARNIEEVPVIFVPLHHFDLSDDLTSAMEQFIKEERFLSESPLDATEGKERLLIIFDGLDELSMQGKAAAETAQYFVEEIIAKIDKFNGQGLQRQVLITGRDLAVQAASRKLRGKRQILHVLPYFISDEKRTEFIDENKLLEEDQRVSWWNKYGISKGIAYEGMPSDLNIDRLTPITKEPLLNYLVALSYERKNIEFSSQTTLNKIYEDLLLAVHERQWDHGRHEGAKHLEIKEFVRVLEEIALAVWHGDGRTATVNSIFEKCENSNLVRYLEAFQEGAKKGISRLLTAFYFRQSKNSQTTDKTFEFTHKSFGEFLTARRIVRLIRQIDRELKYHDDDPDSGFDEREALKRWAELCGPTTMDRYVYQFLLDEISAYPDELGEWQRTFAKLISHAVRNGIPMEKTNTGKFKSMMINSRNAEESLMIVHHACAINTRNIISINWGEISDFGDWIKRLQGSRSESSNRLILKCLDFLDLRQCSLNIADFFNVKMESSILDRSTLILTTFCYSDLSRVSIEEADLTQANCKGARFHKANLRRSDLIEANFKGSHLYGANLSGANLSSANLIRANLKNANLEAANFESANLTNTNLINANLEGANLQNANLIIANLKGANLEEANLEGANLEEANLEGASLKEANLKGANLEEANLEGADLEAANLEGADLEAANLEGANLKGANLEDANLKDTIIEDSFF